MTENKQYGLILPNKSARSKAIISKTSVFGNDEEEDEKREVFNGRPTPKYNVQTDSKKAFLKRQVQADIEKALAEDPNAFEYDSVYDDVQEKKQEHVKKTETSKADRKPKYITGLMKAADTRKKEHERRLEKTVQKEREEEKGKYDDKESFVTGAYKKKMEEMKLEEEKERQKQLLEDRMDVTKQEDMSLFYRNILNQTTTGSALSFTQAADTKPTIKEEPEMVATTSSAASGMPDPNTLYPEDRDDSSSENSGSDNDSTSSDESDNRKTKEGKSKSNEKPNSDNNLCESGKSSDKDRSKSKDVEKSKISDSVDRYKEDGGHRESSEKGTRREERERNTDSQRGSHREESNEKNRDGTTSRHDKHSQGKHKHSEDRHRDRDTQHDSNRHKREDNDKEDHGDHDSGRHRKKNDERRKESRGKIEKFHSSERKREGAREDSSRDFQQHDRKKADGKRRVSSSEGHSSDNADTYANTDTKTKAQQLSATSEQSGTKFAKKTVDSALNDARAKYLARKATIAPIATEDSE